MEPKKQNDNSYLKGTEECLENIEMVCKQTDRTLTAITALYFISAMFIIIGLLVSDSNIGVIIGAIVTSIIVIGILMLLGNLILSSYWWKKEVLTSLKEINEKNIKE